MIPCQRPAFEVPDDVAYFNCAYMAPMLKAVRQAAHGALDHVARPWQVTADDFFSPAERARARFAELIHARPDDVAIIPSASFGVSTAARNLALAPGRVILVAEEEFPSNVYPWQALAQRTGGELRVVRRPADHDWTRAVLAAIDDRVAIAALANCHWADGGVIDLAAVSRALQRVGARLSLDVTQSLGVMPLDVSQVKVDYLACAAYKWLLGPYSIGFLYVAPEHHGGEPLDYNWITRDKSENFAGLVDYRDGYQPGARRFDMGERASFVLLPMAIAALDQLLAWTPAATAATLAALTRRIADAAVPLGATVAPPHLRAHRVFASVRGRTLRIAPHLHVTDADLDRLLAALRAHVEAKPLA